MIKIKRAYEAPDSVDGTRILVDRLWPRGVKKEALRLDRWAKELSPSKELCEWFAHDPAKWEEFRRRYEDELRGREPELAPLLELSRKGSLTLVYGAKDEEHNNALVLQGLLRRLAEP